VDRLTRKELKTDKFALEVGHTVEYLSEHRQQVVRWGSIIGAVVVVALIIYGFLSYRAGVREDALRQAIQIGEAPVSPTPSAEMQTFTTPELRDEAFKKALTDVASRFPGSDQAAVANYYLGALAASSGDLPAAERLFRDAIANGSKNHASLARLSIAPVLQAQGKAAEGESMLRSLVDNPTTFVSKEQATIALARYIAPTKPDEARKLLEPLRTERSAISRAALTALAELPQPQAQPQAQQ
jgi:hypothetical protein